MSDFLSDEWIRALDERLGTDPSGAPAHRIVIQYDIGGDDGVTTYHLVLGPDGAGATAGPAPDADVTFTMDEATAKAVSAGDLGTQEAFIMGKLDIDGDPAALIDAYRSRDGA